MACDAYRRHAVVAVSHVRVENANVRTADIETVRIGRDSVATSERWVVGRAQPHVFEEQIVSVRRDVEHRRVFDRDITHDQVVYAVEDQRPWPQVAGGVARQVYAGPPAPPLSVYRAATVHGDTAHEAAGVAGIAAPRRRRDQEAQPLLPFLAFYALEFLTNMQKSGVISTFFVSKARKRCKN